MNKYKVGDKVVFTVTGMFGDVEYQYYALNKDFSVWEKTIDKYSEPLSTYTEPLEAKIKRQAAEITRLLAENKELKEDFEKSKRVNLNIGRVAGQNEAWELALKLRYMDYEDKVECFGLGYDGKEKWIEVMENYTYAEAAAKVSQWEKAKEEIKVGDVYKSLSGNFVVCGIDREKDMVKALWDDLSVGKIYLYEIKEQYTKTGRHIDIDSFLKQIGEE